MEIVIIITGFLLLIAGFAGCFLPVLPGPPLSYLAIILLHFTGYANDGKGFSTAVLVLLGLLALGIFILDLLVPVYGAKRTGSSKSGIIGSSIGIVAGLFFTGATGGISLIAFPFIGAVVGELIAGRSSAEAMRAGIGTFLGFLAGTFFKVVAALIITGFYIVALF